MQTQFELDAENTLIKMTSYYIATIRLVRTRKNIISTLSENKAERIQVTYI